VEDWRGVFRNGLQNAVSGHAFWEPYLESMMQGTSTSGLHLAIFIEPYLEYILEGKKTVESRFSERRVAPYERVNKEDVILLKRSGGPVTGLCRASDTWYYELDPQSWREIRTGFSQMLCAQDPDFWRQRKSAEFATLIRLTNVMKIQPFKYSKSDRRGWVVLKPGGEQAI
jgi:hypothetical protein